MSGQTRCYVLDVDGHPAMVRGPLSPDKMAPETLEAVKEMIRAAHRRIAEPEAGSEVRV